MTKTVNSLIFLFLSLFLISCNVVTKRTSPTAVKVEPPPVAQTLTPQEASEIPSAQDVLKEREAEGLPTPQSQDTKPQENREPSESNSAKETPAANPQISTSPALAWSYMGENGPDRWGDLDPSFILCKTGKQQSPIDLKWRKQTAGGEIAFDYKESEIKIIDTGHTLQIRFAPGSFVKIRGQEFELQDLQFRSGSEHTISGEHLPMEAQLFHKNKNGMVAVLSIMMIEGKENKALEKLWSNWPQAIHQEVSPADLKWSAKDLLPPRFTYYSYDGSLTTPPCSEGISWNVFNSPIQMSKDQILNFRRRYRLNARPVQPPLNRKLTLY